MVMKRKWRNRSLERGVLIDRRGYVYVRAKRQGVVRKELIGRTTDVDVIDRANFRAQAIRYGRYSQGDGFEGRKQRLLTEDAADVFMRLHGEKRSSPRGINQFRRYVRLVKTAWAGRYVDTLIGDDMHEYREHRRRTGVAESTINREHTAIITMFNKLVEWRRSGQIPRSVCLPESNPGKGAKKVNEDRFVRGRLLSDAEYANLWACADDRTRRIILAEMNLPLRLSDLKQLRKDNVNYKTSQFRGVQAKTGHEYTLPINRQMWELIRSAPGDAILDFTGFARRWKRTVKRAGLHPRGQRPLIQFRDLRRTAATTLHDAGVPLRTVSAMLGHRSVMTTIRYLGLKSENLIKAGEVLSAKYSVPVKNDSSLSESVPKVYQPTSENAASKTQIHIENTNTLAG